MLDLKLLFNVHVKSYSKKKRALNSKKMKINSFFYVSKETRLMTFKINKQEAKI